MDIKANKPIWIVGIHTDVGKTVVSGLVAYALEADYWKPVQAGSLTQTDTDRVSRMLRLSKGTIHSELHRFENAMSPHAAALLEHVEIDWEGMTLPATTNRLVIETAGGIFSPFTANKTMLDLLKRWPGYVLLVSRHYVGSINHTLMTIETLENKGITINGIIYSDEKNEATESFIAQAKPAYPSFRTGQIDEADPLAINRVAHEMKEKLSLWLN